MRNLSETVTWATGKLAATCAVSSLEVTLMTLADEATEDLGEQLPPPCLDPCPHGVETHSPDE